MKRAHSKLVEAPADQMADRPSARLSTGSTRRAWLVAAALGGVGLASAATGVLPAAWAQPAVPPEVARALPAARLQGGGLLRFFGLRVYDARLWVGEQPVPADGERWDGLPLALELAYHRRLVGEQIATRSLQEMQRVGEVAEADGQRWLADMKRLFPDVEDGDRLTGVLQPQQGARFYLNGEPRGEVADAEFARLFFGIWLSPRTSEPGLRAALLGGR
jgi:hypothetical protein